MADLDIPLKHQLLDVTQTQTEAVIQPHAVADDLHPPLNLTTPQRPFRARPTPVSGILAYREVGGLARHVAAYSLFHVMGLAAAFGKVQKVLIKKLGHVLLRAADLDRSREFYSGILGMRIMEDDPDHPEVCTFMTLGEDFHNLDLARHPSPESAQKPREDQIGLVHVAFQMESWDAMRQMYQVLQENGIEILSASDHVNQRSMYVKDPDGNVVEFYYEIPDAIRIFADGRDDRDENLPLSEPGSPLPEWLINDWPETVPSAVAGKG